jgi:hypothetical protein
MFSSSRLAPGQLWVVRGTVRDQDISIVVEARSREEAEAIGWKRDIPVIVVSEASEEDVLAARQAKLLRRYTAESQLKCLGRPVGPVQIATLLLCGVVTALLDLHAAGAAMHL